MKKYLLTVLLLATTTPATAATTAQYFGMQGMINIAPPRFGEPDTDSKSLMDAMNVPVQGSMMGPGKSIVAEGQVLNFICGERGGGQVQCSIFIQKNSPHSTLSPNLMKYEVFGDEAAAIHPLFFPNQNDGSYQFRSVDGLFQVQATPNHFVIQFQQ
jgi:hypothetical protein